MPTTSQVFPVMARLYTLFHDETTFPVHPQSGETPVVVLGGVINDDAREVIAILGAPPDAPELDFAVLGVVGIDEAFAVRIVVVTAVPGMQGAEVLDRLKNLTNTVQIKLRDQTTGRPAGAMPNPVLWHHVGRIMPTLALGPEGVVGESNVDVLFRSRI